MHRIGEHAVVVGGSFAGVLAARALTEAYDRVTVIDRDVLHDDGGARRAVPQGLHAHALLPLGQRCLEQLLPGSVADLVADGAASCAALEDYRFVLAGSPLARLNTGNRAVFASRPFIEGHVRARVRALPGVELRDRCDVVGVVADGPRVTGVRTLRREAESEEETLAADLVVAAGGRGARVPAWLEHLGFERPEEERLTVDVAYASRFVRLPEEGLGDARMALFTATPEWPRALYVFPQEGGRHIVSLGGYGAAHRPPADPDAFTAFALSVAPPDLHPSIAGAEPLSDVAVHAFPASVRRRYDRLARFPDGLLVCGDAIASFNPTYGQGLSVAAAEAVALRDCLAGGERGLARRFFAATARGPLGNAWDVSTGSDLALPQVPGPRPARVRLLNRYLRRLRAAAEHDHAVAGALIAVTGLLEEPRTLLAPGIVRRVARRPRAAGASAPSRSRPLRVGAVTTPLREAGPADASEAVVFVHGNPGSGADFEPLLAAVGAHGRRAVAWDAPGFGRAAGGFPQTVEAHAAFVGDALAALGIERAHLVLHDFGGPWGLRWAAGDPERFASAVLLGTGALPGYRWHVLARVWRAPLLGELFMATTTRPGFRMLMRRGQRTRLPAAFVDRMYDDFDRATRRAVLALYRSVDDVGQRGRELAAALAPLDRPALVLWGADDPYLGVEQAARQRLAFPHADVRVLEGAGHWPFVDRPAEVAAALLEHLDREWRRGESNPQLSLAKAVCSR
jgi:pimeloyl-ACP methyl ester carboxylesterase/2-polyprenyl-6-methoxyphenol hydroxylase-like FAD-dependent oxidoreductase